MDRREFFRMLLAALTTLPFLSWLRPQETAGLQIIKNGVPTQAVKLDMAGPHTAPPTWRVTGRTIDFDGCTTQVTAIREGFPEKPIGIGDLIHPGDDLRIHYNPKSLVGE